MKLLLVATGLALTSCGTPAPGVQGALEPMALAQRPNILLILADDLGYADLGFTGCQDIPTPHLDELARNGVVFTDGHVSASVCAPSRAGLLTGRYQQRDGFEANMQAGHGLLPGTATLPGRLRQAGYRTAAVGKWHVGDQPHNHPMALGFDHFTGLLGGSRSYFPLGKAPRKAQRIERDGTPVSESSFDYLTDFFTAEGVARIEEHGTQAGGTDAPLFLYMSYTAPHGPMHAKPEDLERFGSVRKPGRAKYAAMVSALDRGVGELLRALEDQGMANNTLVVFLSDNGGATNNHSDNGPWRGMKGSKWEGGQRVPFVMGWPGQLAPGTYPGATSSLDLTPTFLRAAGAPVPESETDGVDLLPHLNGEKAMAPRTLYWRRAVVAAIRMGDWKLIRVTEEDGSLRAPVLVNLATDPGELVNRAKDEPVRVDALTHRLEAWDAELMGPRWMTGEIWRDNQRAKHQPGLVGRDAERRLP